MNTDNDRITELFKKSLDGIKIEPSPAVWKGIKGKYLKNLPGKLNLLHFPNLLAGLVVSSLGISLLATIFHIISPKENVNLTAPLQNPTQIISDTLITAISPSVTHGLKVHSIPGIPDIKSQPVTEPSKNQSTTEIHTEKTDPDSQVIKKLPEPQIKPIGTDQNKTNQFVIKAYPEKNYSDITSENASDINITASYETLPDLPKNLTKMPLATYILSFNYSPFISETHNYLNTPIRWKDDYGTRSSLELGIHVSPEITNYRQESTNSKAGYYLDLSATYHFSEFFLKGGIGMGISTDNGQYIINYERYDSIGYFYSVNYFTVTPGYPDSVVFSTTIQTIYDSVYHSDQASTPSRYSYIRIPVSLGFDFFTYRRLSLSLMAGPVFTILVNEHETPATLSDPQASLISIANQTPDRIKTSWQFAACLGISFQMTNKLRFSLEPTYTYFIQPVYDIPGTSLKNPFSLGCRAGLYIKF
ncbi:MAG: outer membrane beta-barrel protein [Bacteroidetes bacterium]|nr:outer membrane beta-barrel protein [Bacteroidota bacterium]